MKRSYPWKNITTIREAVCRCQDEGYPLTEYRLRKMIKAGAIPYNQIGNRILLYYPNLTEYLCADNPFDVVGKTTREGV